jgi:hypothetical protein
MAGGIGLEGQLALRLCQRQPDGPEQIGFEVLWDGTQLKGDATATREWQVIRLPLPGPPAPGRHEVLIKSPVQKVDDPSDPNRSLRFGLMVDSVSVE